MYSSRVLRTLGRRLGRTKNDRLGEVRSNCHYSALNRSFPTPHTVAHSKFAWLGVDYFGLSPVRNLERSKGMVGLGLMAGK